MVQAFSVPSISCQHCVNAITQSVSKVPGVATVQVDLGQKQVKVESNQAVPTAQVLDAIVDAGYEDATVIA